MPRIVVETGAAIGMNLKMELGTVTQTVQVTSAALLLNTVTADSGETVTGPQIEDLPLNGQSAYTLARIAPGVIVAGAVNETLPYNVSGNSYVSINGARRYETVFTLNGVPNVLAEGYFNGRLAYNPPADAVQEFRVVTEGFDAQYGGYADAGVISLTTKSGTNQFHGSLYEYVQNNVLNANNFFTNRTGGKKPPQRFNQFGGSMGGPLLIPKLNHGSNRAYFFFAYEGIRNGTPGATYATVPTAAMRAGNFSALPATIYNPFSTYLSGTTNLRNAFAGNMIPGNLISSIAANVLNYVPLPNAGASTATTNNFFTNNGSWDHYNNYLGRFDLNVGTRQRWFFSEGKYTRDTVSGDTFSTLATGSTVVSPMAAAAVADTITLSPTTILDARLGYSGYYSITLPKSVAKLNPTSLGFPSSLVSQMAEQAFPIFSFSNYTGFGTGGHVQLENHLLYGAVTLSHIRGAHSMQFGFETHYAQDNNLTVGDSAGAYTFNGQATAGPGLLAGPAFGQDFASFLLGLPSSGQFDFDPPEEGREKYYALYAKDDWKITPRLTLNIGLRYDFETPGYEKYNRLNGGWLNGPNPIQAAAQANYALHPDASLPASQFQVPGGIEFLGTSVLPTKDLWSRNWGLIQPRLGLAWNPSMFGGRLSVRAGGAIEYCDMGPQNLGSTGYWQFGYQASTPFVSSTNNGLTFTSTLSNPFPSGLLYPTGNSLGPTTVLGTAVNVMQNSNYLYTRLNEWEFSLQAQVTANDLLEARYSGETDNHVIVSFFDDYIPLAYMGTGAIRNTTAINYLSAQVANPFQGLIPASTSVGGATISRYQLLSNYPEFVYPTYLRQSNSGSITFNSANFGWKHRMAKGLTVSANYELSKQFWGRDPMEERPSVWSRRIASEDFTNQVTMSGTWQLPFGKSQHFLSTLPKVPNGFVDGWRVAGIYFIQSGPAIVWGQYNTTVFTGQSWSQIPQVPGGRNINEWFNTALFDRAAADQPNALYQLVYFPSTNGSSRSPGINQMDFTLSKTIRVRENMPLVFRADFFNLFNHPAFGAPNVTPTSSAFGTITSITNTPRQIQLGLHLTF